MLWNWLHYAILVQNHWTFNWSRLFANDSDCHAHKVISPKELESHVGRRKIIHCICRHVYSGPYVSYWLFCFLKNKIKLNLVNKIFFSLKIWMIASQWLILNPVNLLMHFKEYGIDTWKKKIAALIEHKNSPRQCHTLILLEGSLLAFSFWLISTISICYNSHTFCQLKDAFNHPTHIMLGSLLERISEYAFSCNP